jgi:hypothetical protein
MNGSVDSIQPDGPMNLARAAAAMIQARSDARRLRDELAIAADILAEAPEEELREALATGRDRETVIARYRTAIVLLDDVEENLIV